MQNVKRKLHGDYFPGMILLRCFTLASAESFASSLILPPLQKNDVLRILRQTKEVAGISFISFVFLLVTEQPTLEWRRGTVREHVGKCGQVTQNVKYFGKMLAS